jgi:mannose-6-phosphate isomerase-like protein (cupin superfamily)
VIVVRCHKPDREALARTVVDPETIKDDGTDYTDIRVEKPWGYEKERYRDENVSVWWLHLHHNQQTSMHCHPNKTTMLVVAGGIATVSTLNGTYRLEAGDMMVIERGAFHRTASSDGVAVMLYEIETPPNKRDLVRLEDVYGRGQGYEYVA